MVTKDPERLGVRRRRVPANVEAAIHKALAKLPADRFASADAFVQALSEPATAATMPTFTRAAPAAGPAPDKRRTVAIAVAMLLLAALAAWGWLRPQPRNRS